MKENSCHRVVHGAYLQECVNSLQSKAHQAKKIIKVVDDNGISSHAQFHCMLIKNNSKLSVTWCKICPDRIHSHRVWL